MASLEFPNFVNNWEDEDIKAQLRKGKKDSVKMGRWSNGTPYGLVYNRLNRSIELNKLCHRTNRGRHFSGIQSLE
ncbi:hypothetical protein J25TS1_34240 [Bacillus paralicheniformis]|nr:hypothetical protein J23TS8_37850 [Bacillus paralicheniformis]GIN50170.1 hypothetical protein J25TS1_34240 [Bacillus paralicheniformis]